MNVHRAASLPGRTFPAEAAHAVALPSCFSSHPANKCPTQVCLAPRFSGFLHFMLQLKMASKHRAKVLSSVPECRTAVMRLKEKIHVLDKLYSGMSDSALAVSSLLMNHQYVLHTVSLNRNHHRSRLCIDKLIEM